MHDERPRTGNRPGRTVKRPMLVMGAILIGLPLYLAFVAVSFSVPWATRPAVNESGTVFSTPRSGGGLSITVGAAALSAMRQLYASGWRVVRVDTVGAHRMHVLLHHPGWEAGAGRVPARLQVESWYGVVVGWALLVAPASAEGAARLLGHWLASAAREWGRPRMVREATALEAKRLWSAPDSLTQLRRRVFWGSPPLARVPSTTRYWDWWTSCGVLEIGADDPALLEMRSEWPADPVRCDWRAAQPAPLDQQGLFAPIPWATWQAPLEPTGAPTMHATPAW